MEPTAEQLENRLRDLGMVLASPPSDIDRLLYLLDETEIYLSRVEQSPSTSMSDALSTVMNSLIDKVFLNHSNMDVKVFVAACFNEIMRITAPDAPYDNYLMKEIFALIVDAFGDLDDISGCSYSKRVSILEIMAKIRSCLVMLDLECDELILQMFKHFLKSIRPEHPANVFSSMETIMTLILEECEDISQNLLICLLSNDEKSKTRAMPVACSLAEKVISNCALNLKPYLFDFKSKNASFVDHSGIFASMCQESSNTLENTKDSQKLVKPAICLEASDTLLDRTKNMLSNEDMPLGNGNSPQPISPVPKPDSPFLNDQCRNDAVLTDKNCTLDSEKPDNDQVLQHTEVKSPFFQLRDGSDSSHQDEEAVQSLKSESASDIVLDTKELVEPEMKSELKPSEGVSNDTNVNLEAPSYNLSEKDFLTVKITALESVNFPEHNEMCGKSALEKKGFMDPISEFSDLSFVNISEGKLLQDSGKALTEDRTVAEIGDGITLEKEQNETNVMFAKEVIIAQSVSLDKLINDGKQEQKLGLQLKKKRRMKEAVIAQTIVSTESFDDEKLEQKLGVKLNKKRRIKKSTASSKILWEENNNENNLLKLPVTTKEKHQSYEGIPSSKAFCETNNDEIDQQNLGATKKKRRLKNIFGLHMIDMEIVGRKIEVWWPNDERFYEGVIESYDPIAKKHKILYDDGDVEILFLNNERWNYIDSKDFQREQRNVASPKYPIPIPIKKRRSETRKASSDKNEIKIEEPFQINASSEPPRDASTRVQSEEPNMKRKRISPSGEKSERSKGTGKASTLAVAMKSIKNDSETIFKSYETERLLDGSCTHATSDSNFIAKSELLPSPRARKLVLKPKPRALEQETTLNAPSEDIGIKIEAFPSNRCLSSEIRSLEQNVPKLSFLNDIGIENKSLQTNKLSDMPSFKYVSKSKQELKKSRKKKQKFCTNNADANAV